MTSTEYSANSVFTVGHSNLEPQDFVHLLKLHSIALLCDVRSKPGSVRFPQFNREPLEHELMKSGVQYQFWGETLGGRPADPGAYHSDGRVNYVARRAAPDFADAIRKIVELSRDRQLALMCAEEDPLHCHRFLMICPALVESKASPRHVRRGGILESQRDAEDRLLLAQGFGDVATGSLFASGRDAALRDALELQAKERAFRLSPDEIENW